MCVKRSGDCHSSNGNHPEYAASPLGGCRLGRCTHGRCDGLAILHPAAVAAQDSAGAAINAATGDLSQRLVIDPAQIRSGLHDPVMSDAHNALISGMHDTAGATPRGIPTLFSGFASVTEFLAALDAAGLPSALQEIAVIRDGIRVSSAGRIAVDDAAIEVYQLDGPDAVAAVLDGFRGEGGVTFQRPANVTLWGSGALLVILVNAPASARISRSHVPRTTRVAHGSGSWPRERARSVCQNTRVMDTVRLRCTLLGMAVAVAMLLGSAVTFVGAGPTVRAGPLAVPVPVASQQGEAQFTALPAELPVAPPAVAATHPDSEQDDVAPAWVWGVIGGLSAGVVGLGLAYAVWLRRRGAALNRCA